jgi:hypothetical protein
MSTSSRSSSKGVSQDLPVGPSDLDRLFGSDFSSKGWVVDLTGLAARSDDRDDALRRVKEALDPAMIWVMGGRRRR